MLSIGKLGRGQERYYLDKVAEGAEDYYSGEGETEGYWLGDAADDLGLYGEVGPEQLKEMLTEGNLLTGEPLGLRHVEGGAIPGFDLTFSAPKSVSPTWALGGPRRQQILEAAGEGASARARQIATLATREAKDRDVTTESLRDLWREKATQLGLDREAIHAAMGRPISPGPPRLSADQIAQLVTSDKSHFDRRDVIQAVANRLPAGAPGYQVEELADAYLATPDVIEIATSAKGSRFTTRAIWQLEQKALGTVEVMAAREDCARVSETVVSRVLAKRPSMKPDQRAMVERLLGGGEGVTVVVGEAGPARPTP